MRTSASCMSTIARIFALFLLLVLILLLPLSMLARSIERTLFSPGVLSEAVASAVVSSQGIRTQLTENLLGDMWRDMAGETIPDDQKPLANLTAKEYEQIAEIIISADWFRDQVSTAIGDVVSWIESDDPFPVLEVELISMRLRFLEGGAREVIEVVVGTWPACTLQQTEFIQRSLMRGELSLPAFCQMPDGQQEPWIISMEESILMQVEMIPDRIPIGDSFMDPEGMGDLLQMRTNLRFLQAGMRWMWVLPMLLMGLIVVLAVRSWRDLGLWWGIPLLLSGLVLGALGLLIGSKGPGLMQNLLQERELPAWLLPPIKNAFHVVQEVLMGRMIIQLVLILLIGGGLLILTQSLTRMRRGGALKEPQSTVNAVPGGDQNEPINPAGGPPPVTPPDYSQDQTLAPTEPEEPPTDGMFG